MSYQRFRVMGISKKHWLVVVIGLFFGLFWNVYGQADGFTFIRNYSYKEYSHTPQNWAIAQAPNGLLYVANQGGILEYDGVSWRVIGIPDYVPVRSLDISENGIVYIGGENKIGYLAPDASGTLSFRSLLDSQTKIKKTNTDFGKVWNTHALQNKIYFRTSKALYYWHNEKMTIIPTTDSFKASFIWQDELIVQEGKRGLFKVRDTTLIPIPGGEVLAGERLFCLGPYQQNSLLLGTNGNGFFIYNGQKAISFNISEKVKQFLRAYKISHGLRLPSGDYALATLGGGILVMDHTGGYQYIINRQYGLQENNVKYIFQDKHGNIWFCLSNGLAKLEYNSPISIYDERAGLTGIVLSVLKHHHEIYAGTENGLFHLEEPNTFRFIKELPFACWSLISSGDMLLVATVDGVFQYSPGLGGQSVRKILDAPVHILYSSPHRSGQVWCGTEETIELLSKTGNLWAGVLRLSTEKQAPYSLVEDQKGFLWCGTLNGRVLKVDIDHALVTTYSQAQGVPEGEVQVTMASAHVVLLSRTGLFRFNEGKNRFEPDGFLGETYRGSGNSKPIFRLIEDQEKQIWFHSEGKNYQAIPTNSYSYKIHKQPFLRIPVIQVNSIYQEPETRFIWFASVEGLIRYNPAVQKNYNQTFSTLVRRVTANENQKNERAIFCGEGNHLKRPFGTVTQTLEYPERNLHFEFAAPFFEAEEETTYRYFLEGYDEDWSQWSKNRRKSYTNLHPGGYTFRVQARNVYLQPGQESMFRFYITAPWYMQWWAYILYSVLLVVLIFSFIHWRSRQLEWKNQQLEKTIQERTREIQIKNQQLSMQSEQLKELDKAKSRFFTNISHEFRTPLTLIMGPLEQILSLNRDKTEKRKFQMMLRSARRLLGMINQLLDLSCCDSGQMKLKVVCQNIVPFIGEIVGALEALARQNEITINYVYSELELSVYFDAQRMEEVLYNLMVNAIKFTPPTGRITVTVGRKISYQGEDTQIRESGVYISVQDTGSGIPQAEMEHIFDRFYQVSNFNTHHVKGSGIGLALAKEIVQLHGGTIDVHSQEGKGSEFVIHLLAGHSHFKAEEIVLRSDVVKDKVSSNQLKTLYVEVNEDFKVESETQSEVLKISQHGDCGDEVLEDERQVILVVEDNVEMRQYIQGALLEVGYRVVEAADGEEGLNKAREIIPDLIVSDIMMPKVEGDQLCRVLKREMATSHIPIILLTAKASEAHVIKGLQTGADDYVTKPFNTQILLTRIKNLIELRRQFQLKIQREQMLLPVEIAVSSVDDQFLSEFQKVIEENLSNNELCIEVLCKALTMSRMTLIRKVKAITGENPIAYIQSYRLKRAAHLLKKNFGNVTEVSQAVGFTNPGSFSDAFKKKFKRSPHSYKVAEGQSHTK